MKIDSSSIGIITHDLKGPVGNVTMFSEMLVSMLETAQEEIGMTYDLKSTIWYAEYIQLITAKYMDQLQNWSDLYYIKEGKAQYELAFVDISFVLESVIKANKIFIEKKNLKIEKSIKNGIVVKTEADLIRRILDNLIQLVVLLVNQNQSVSIQLDEEENEIRFSISGLSSTDKPVLDTLFLEDSDLSSAAAFSKGLIKTTGLGLAFCHTAIVFSKGKPFLEIENDILSVGFTLSNADE